MNSTNLLMSVVLSALLAACSSADVFTWDFTIDEQQIRNGPESDGSTNSPGTGTGIVSYDAGTNLMSYSVQWEGLIGDLTKLHIHGPADAGMSNPQHVVEIFGPPAVPVDLATTSGSVAGTFELTTLEQTGFDPLSPSQILDIMTSGKSYINVHTTVFGTGEIRGNLGIPIPEPSTAAMLLGAFGSLIFVRRMSM